MPEPTTTTISAFVAAASAFTLTLLGVEYHALVWALAGALAALAMAPAQQQDAQRAALAAAQAELDEERRVLEDRASQVSADRLVIAAQRDHIRKQKPELAVFGGGNV